MYLNKFPNCCKPVYLYWLLSGCAQSTQLRCRSFILCWTGQWVIPVFASWLFSPLRKSKFSQTLSSFTPSGFSDFGDIFFSLCCWNKCTLLPSFSWVKRWMEFYTPSRFANTEVIFAAMENLKIWKMNLCFPWALQTVISCYLFSWDCVHRCGSRN